MYLRCSLRYSLRNPSTLTGGTINLMANFDCKTFTDRVFKRYSTQLRERIQRVRYVLEDDPAVVAAKDVRSFRYLGDYAPFRVNIDVDDHLRGDGTLQNEEELAEGVASGLSEPLITAAA